MDNVIWIYIEDTRWVSAPSGSTPVSQASPRDIDTERIRNLGFVCICVVTDCLTHAISIGARALPLVESSLPHLPVICLMIFL